jgi:hypothetical protein
MQTAATIRRQAIQAAKTGDWQAAVDHNQQLLNQYPDDTNALNRLGIAYVQIKDISKAKKAFQKSLEFDRANMIARKHLDKLLNNQEVGAPAFIKQQFIEEPGKTKTVELHRLASKQVLAPFKVGDSCQLKLKNRYISVNINGVYIGALPEDVSFRLARLIESGNEYDCFVRSCDGKSCFVFLKEVKQSPENVNLQSFPGSKTILSQGSDFDNLHMLEDDIPMEIVDTDTDMERSLDDMDREDLE